MTDRRLNLELARNWLAAAPAVSAYIAAMVPHHHEAADLIQRTALAVVEKYDDYDPERPFIGWALGIARFEVLNWRRSAGRDRHVFSDAAAKHLEDAALALAPDVDARMQALHTCMKKLGDTQADLLARRYRDDTELKALAEELGLSRPAVSMKLARIRRSLRDCIERRLEEEAK